MSEEGIPLAGLHRLAALGAEIRGEGDPLLRDLRVRLGARERVQTRRSSAAILREERAGHGPGRFACWACRRLGLQGARQTCPGCGYAHGSAGHHDAVPVR